MCQFVFTDKEVLSVLVYDTSFRSLALRFPCIFLFVLGRFGHRCATVSPSQLQQRLAGLMAKLDGPAAQQQVCVRVRACHRCVLAGFFRAYDANNVKSQQFF